MDAGSLDLSKHESMTNHFPEPACMTMHSPYPGPKTVTSISSGSGAFIQDD